MNINITGASGFVGQNLIKYLSSSTHQIYPINRDNLQTLNLNLQSGSVIVHLAGKAHDLRKAPVEQEYYDVNLLLTKKLFDHFLHSEAKIFIFISSVKAAADKVVNHKLDENHECSPQTHYGKSKLLAEQYILSKVMPAGKHFYILRPCMIHGPLNKGNLNLLFNVVRSGIPYPLAAFYNKRSFLSIENLCFVILELINQKTIVSGIYNVSDDETLSTNDVIRIFASTLGKKVRLLKVPKTLVKILANVGSLLNLPLNNERLEKLTESYIVDNEKIKRAIKKEFPVSAKAGLIKTAQSFQNLK